MAKTEHESRKRNKADDKKGKDGKEKKKGKDGKGKKKGKGKKGEKEKEYEPGMASSEYDPCPHRVWTPKPGERDKSEPRGLGSPWYVPVRKKVDVEKEEAEKKEEKEKKAREKRQKGYEERQKQKEEEDKKRKVEEEKKAEKDKKREEKKKKREKEKKKREDEKRRKQKEEREKRKEEEKKAAEEDDGKGKEKEKDKPQASYMYDPCPHRVYTPAPGERDMADPKGVGSPWYVPVRKKEDLQKEEEETKEEDNEKRKEAWKKRQQEKKEQERKEEEERIKNEERKEKEERKAQERRRKETERRRREREQEDMEREEMGQGVRKSETDFTPELVMMMDFMRSVDEKERERRGEALRWKKEEVEKEVESHLAKEAFTKDFQGFLNTFIEAEWGRADKKLIKLKKDERKKRKRIFKNMDPLAKELMEEGKRFNTLYKAAIGKERKEAGDGEPSSLEDMMVSMIMQQMDKLVEPASGRKMQDAFSPYCKTQ